MGRLAIQTRQSRAKTSESHKGSKTPWKLRGSWAFDPRTDGRRMLGWCALTGRGKQHGKEKARPNEQSDTENQRVAQTKTQDPATIAPPHRSNTCLNVVEAPRRPNATASESPDLLRVATPKLRERRIGIGIKCKEKGPTCMNWTGGIWDEEEMETRASKENVLHSKG